MLVGVYIQIVVMVYLMVIAMIFVYDRFLKKNKEGKRVMDQ